MSDLEIISFLNRLRQSEVRISLEGEQLGVVFEGEQDDLLLGEIRTHKTRLVQFLQSAVPERQPVTRVEEKQAYPLAPAQKRIWLHEKLEPGNRAYHIHADVMVQGELEPTLLNESLRLAVAKHEALRTVFTVKDNVPLQSIRQPEDVEAVLEVVPFDAPFGEECFSQIIASRNAGTFDLQTGPLFRLVLYRFEHNDWLLSFSIHHIIADAQSLSVLIADLIQTYQSLRRSGAADATPAPLQFKDFAAWEEEQRTLPSFDASRAYWKEQFAEQPVPVSLPYRQPRGSFKTYNGEVNETRMSEEDTLALQRHCREHGATPFAFFYATVQALLFRYTEQNDLTLGTSLHGRDNPAFQRQVGLYARTLPLRLRFDDDASFDRLLQAAKGVVQNALVHQEYPFDLLIDESKFARDPSRSPFFDIMIDYFTASALPDVEGLDFRNISFAQTTSKFDLTFTFLDESDSVRLRIEYNTDLFDAAFISQLSAHYHSLLRSLLQCPQLPVSSLPFLSKTEKNKLLTTFGCGQQEFRPFVPVGRCFEMMAAAQPHRMAVSCEEREMDYQTLNRAANRLAHHLKSRVQKGDVVGIMLERSERLVIAALAVVKSGAAFVPIDPEAPAAYRQHLFSDSKASLLITDSHWLADVMGSYEGELFAMDVQLDGLTTLDTNPEEAPAASDLAYVLYTSGSTGLPKGVEVTQGNMSNYLQWAAAYYYKDLGTTSVPWFTSFSFDLSLTSLFTPLLRGDLLEVYPQSNPRDAFLQMLKSNRPFGVMKLTPSHINVLGVLDTATLQVQRVIVGGEALTPVQVAILQKGNPAIRVFNEYGPTETTVGCTVAEVRADDITIGRPMPNTAIYILSRSGELMPPGCWGEIVVGGAGVAHGYRNLPELTHARFVDDRFAGSGAMYRTGDIGYWLPDGRLAYVGRADSQVKINGFRIELGEVEAKLQLVNGIDKAAVLVQEENGSKSLLAFFAGDAALDSTVIRSSLSQHLPAHMLPSVYVHVTEWPLTSNGKTDKAALLKLSRNQSRTSAAAAPKSDKEKALVEFFEELLSVKNLGVDENLFSVGLDSLKAIKAQSLLEERYPGRVQIHDLFSHATVSKLSAHIHGAPAKKEATPEIIDF